MKNKLRIYDPWLFAFAAIATCLGLIVIFDAGFARANQSQRSILPGEFVNQAVRKWPRNLVSCFSSRPSMEEVVQNGLAT